MPPTLSSLPFPQLLHQHSTASLRASPSHRSCELCTQPAALRCDADSAFLCATCDAAVHSANFIVLRHSRHLLCALCSSPTSWEAPSPFHQPAAVPQTQVLCDSCLAVGAVSGITGNAVFHTPCAMSASMAASLLPLHTYAAALSSSAFVPSPPSNVAPESQIPAKRYKANTEDLLAFSQYPPHAKLSQMPSQQQQQQQQLPSLLLAGTTLSQNSLGTANQGQHHCPLSASSSSSSPPETLQLFPTATPSEVATESGVVTPSLTNGTLSQQQPALAQARVVADAAGVVPDLNESLCNENQTVPDASTGKRQRQEEQVAGQAQNVLGGSCANGQGRNVLGQLAAARLKRVLSSWYARLALRGPHVSDLAFHIFQKVLRKLQPGRVAADSLRVTLAACMWTAAKLDDNQKTLPRASDVAAVARVPAKRLQAAELEVMKLVDWRPLEGIFDMVPDAKRLFSMVRESSEPAPVNIKLNAHATMSFRMMCEAFCKWDDAAQVEKSAPFFKALGGRHLNYGIDGNDFPVFRTGFMKALKKAFGERWHGELEGAWCAAFDMLEGVASTGMAEGGGFKRMPAFMLA
ncbi:unnamed protein product [Closterium sp. Naga37s-1]|nr:unnamed protein product [Closterium sp. Naga37s-1]